MPDFFYGGQALIEGVMMRGRTTVAMSVRPPSGEIQTMSEPLPAALSADRKLIKIPFLRGVFLLYETLVIGTRMLMRSAAIAAEGEDVELEQGDDRDHDGLQHRLRHRASSSCCRCSCPPSPRTPRTTTSRRTRSRG